MILSIIIVNWNVKELLQQCLQSIFKHLKNIDLEVMVVDNASGDGSADMVQDNFPQVKLIVNSDNRGFAAANNQGIRQAQGEYLLILNPDTQFIDDSLILLLNYLNNDSKIGLAGCQILDSDQSIQPSVRRFPTMVAMLAILLKLPHLFKIPAVEKYLARGIDYAKRQEVEQVMGAFMVIPKFILSKINLFDENYFIWFEEVDFCRRVKDAGYKIIYFPETKIIHLGGESFKQVLSFKKQLIWNRSLLHYFKKHGSLSAWFLLWFSQPVSLFLALLVDVVNRWLNLND